MTLVSLVIVSPAWPQGTAVIRGTVVDSAGTPLPYSNLILSDRGRFLTDAQGTFELRAPRGVLKIEVRRIGFVPARVELPVQRDTAITLELMRVAQQLDEEIIVATRFNGLVRSGFYDRMRDRDKGLNNGWFVGPEEIDERKALRSTQYLERVPGIRLVEDPFLGAIPVTSSNCALTIYVDGMRVQTEGTRVSSGANMPSLQDAKQLGTPERRSHDRLVTLDQIVGPSSVSAIEVYPRASMAPPMYQLLNGTCGIVAVWTKT